MVPLKSPTGIREQGVVSRSVGSLYSDDDSSELAVWGGGRGTGEGGHTVFMETYRNLQIQ
jgi:hypothetical protein